jgi:hypothetical protein
MHFMINLDAPHTATVLDESRKERTHRISVDAVLDTFSTVENTVVRRPRRR